MNREYLLNDLEILLDNTYPISEYEGSYISVDNTIEGMTGKVECESDCDVVVCNKNIINFKQEDWIAGYFSEQKPDQDMIDYFYTIGNNIIDSKYYPCTAGKYLVCTIKANCKMNFSRGRICYYDNELNPISVHAFFWGNTGEADTIVTKNSPVPEGASYFRLNFMWFATVDEDGTETRIDMYNEFWNYVYDLMVELRDDTNYTDYVDHQEQNYTGSNFNIKCYDEVTHIYNTSDINMTAKVRTKETE